MKRRSMGRIIIDADNLEVKSAPYESHGRGIKRPYQGSGDSRGFKTVNLRMGKIKVIRYERSSPGVLWRFLIFGLMSLVYLFYRIHRGRLR